MNFNDRVYDIVKQIPKGRVVNYGWVALMVGSPHAARAVGYALHNNPYFGVVPCHRVVFANGSLAESFAFGGASVQRDMLESEGIIFNDNGLIDRKYFL